MPKIKVDTVFLTNRDDVSVEYTIEKFRDHSTAYLRINSEDIDLIDYEIVPGEQFKCYIQDVVYDLSNVNSVLFKRVPTKYNNVQGDENNAYLNNERKHFFEGMYLNFQSAKWVNPMFATHAAERKLYQLQVARSLGLVIPESIITNKLQLALNFLDRQNKCIIKPISNGLQVLKDRAYSIYTTEIDSNLFKDLELAETFSTPVFLQKRIPNKGDIRVTIVGRNIFAVRITNDSGEVDWRKPEITKKYQQINLPTKLEKILLEMMRHFKMVYSAIDLIETPAGDFVFLEINPVGEWAWLDIELDLNIADKLIQELL